MNSKHIAQRVAEAIEAVDPTLDDPRAVDARFAAFLARAATTATTATAAPAEPDAVAAASAPPRCVPPEEPDADDRGARAATTATVPPAEPVPADPVPAGAARTPALLLTDEEPYAHLATLRRLHHVMADLNTAGSLSGTLQTVADGAVNGLGYGLACVHLVRPDGDLVVAAVAGDAAAEALITGRVSARPAWERRLSMGEAWGSLRFVPHTEGRALDDDGVPQWCTYGPEPRFDDAWHPCDRLFAPLSAPGASHGELLGVLCVDRPPRGRRPGPWEREALQMYAGQAAVAISNARLRATVQRTRVRLERERQALRASEESFRRAFAHAPSGMAVAELGGARHGRILSSNDALCRLLDRPASALRRHSFSDLVHPEDVGILLRGSAEDGRAEVRLARRDGTYLWVSLRHSVVGGTPDGAGSCRSCAGDLADAPGLLLIHVEDIQERKHRELRLAHRASHDSLTGLPDSAELRARLGARLCDDRQAEPPSALPSAPPTAGFPGHDHVHVVAPEAADGGAKGLAVLFCDLDGFASVNDRFGQHVGDAVLIEVARRLADGVRDGDTVARFGGDEFVVLADGLSPADAEDLSVRLRNTVVRPIRVDERVLRVGATFGIEWARCGMSVEDVLRSADRRMYAAKRSRARQRRHIG